VVNGHVPSPIVDRDNLTLVAAEARPGQRGGHRRRGADREVIPADDFSEARDRILLGRRAASNALLPDEKRAVAVYEAGHALVAVLADHADPVAP
jgi:hypothetical protein